jgi:hypothetical protein
MDVLRSDCGGISGAGEYKFRNGHLIVTLYQIAAWAEHPEAIFTAVEARPGNSVILYVLASWRLPERHPDNQTAAEAVSAAGMSPR